MHNGLHIKLNIKFTDIEIFLGVLLRKHERNRKV